VIFAAPVNPLEVERDQAGSKGKIIWFDNQPLIRLTWIWLIAYFAIGGSITGLLPLSARYPPRFLDLVPLLITAAVGFAVFSYQFLRTPNEVGISKDRIHVRCRKRVLSFPLSEVRWNGIPAGDGFFELRMKKRKSGPYFIHHDVSVHLFNHVFPESSANRQCRVF
jgi:hypothetical protein